MTDGVVGGNVLPNLLGINDPALLKDVEYSLTRQMRAQLEERPIPGDFDLAHLKAIHKHLFGGIYGWAGQERIVNFSKRTEAQPGWVGVFAKTADFERLAQEVHATSKSKNHLQGLDTAAFVEAIAPIYVKWNELHPFPEGNGRATQTMLAQLARSAGHELDFSRVAPSAWRSAAARSLGLTNAREPALKIPPDLNEIRAVFKAITDQDRSRAGVSLEPIRRNVYADADRARVQEQVIEAVQARPQSFIDIYKQDGRSFGGRYIAADLFKETFPQYSASKEARNQYNGPVHNSAAVLSAALFRQVLADKTEPERDRVVFLTGVPGAGKTSSVIAAGALSDRHKMVFEGQLSNPITSIEKIQMVIDAGLKPTIMVVHAQPENALDNTLKRHEEHGRGASIEVMASIQGGLHNSLREVQNQFGDKVAIEIVDVRDRANVQICIG